MRYRPFGNTGLEVSVFGLGCMRFPTEEDSQGNQLVKRDIAIEMIRTAAKNGVNYFDTAYSYHEGESEKLVGEAFSDGSRKDVFIATKCPVWKVEETDDFDKLLDEQLGKLKTDYVDFYLLHSLNSRFWNKIKDLGALSFLDRIKEDERARFVGFSFHDSYDVFRDILMSYSWDMTQIQLNFLDQEYQAGVKGMKLAAQKGIPVVVMEPLRGGRLAALPSEEISAAWNRSSSRKSPVEWAFRWLYNFPEVNVVLSGVSSLDQLKEDIDIFSKAEANCMSEEEMEVVETVRKLYDKRIAVGCTGCNYCMPCPSGVQIPSIFGFYNNGVLYDDQAKQQELYKKWFVDSGRDAQACVECGKCEEACPQELPIIWLLKEAHSYLSMK